MNTKFFYTLGWIVVLAIVIRVFSFAIDFERDEERIATFEERFRELYNVFAITIPDNVYFAGERVPLQDPEVRERYDRELLSNTYFQSQGLLYFKRANRYFPVIEPILISKGIPDDFKYLALIESGFMNVVSPAGAAGFWQFMPVTAKQYQLEVNDYVDERYHLEKATLAACEYLTSAYNKFGSWSLAAAAYNAGSGRIESSLSKQRAASYYDLLLNNETSRYVFRIMAVKEIMSKPRQYGFHFRESDLYHPIPVDYITVTSRIDDLVDFATQNGITYKTLKFHNPWLRNTSLPVAPGKTYSIAIPKPGFRNAPMPHDDEMLPPSQEIQESENDLPQGDVTPLEKDDLHE